MEKQKLTKEEIRKQIDIQKREDKKIDEFFKTFGEINKFNLENFKELFAHEFFVERLLYINNKVFKYKEKISFEQMVALGGVIIPYKQGVANVTINQRVNLLEGDMKDVRSRLGVLEGDMKDVRSRLGVLEGDMKDVKTILAHHSIQIASLQTQMTDMKTQMTDVSSKIDKLTDLLIEHIKTHK